jgi:antitoxin PrlF
MSTYEVTVTSKGQITLPVEIRRLWNLQAGDEVEFFHDHRGVVCARPRNAGPTDFLNYIQPRKRLPEFASDDDALAEDVVSRNVPSGKSQAA